MKSWDMSNWAKVQVAAAPAGLNWPGPLFQCPLVNTNRELKRIILSYLKSSFCCLSDLTDVTVDSFVIKMYREVRNTYLSVFAHFPV